MEQRTSIATVRELLAEHEPRLVDSVDDKRAAVAVVLCPQAEDDCAILFIHRADHPGDPWSGHIALPGGRVDATDASPLAAARRETLEEVAVDLTRSARLLGQLDEVRATARGRILPLIITPYVFELTDDVEIVPNHEVQGVLWVSLSELMDPRSATSIEYTYEQQHLLLPAFRVQQQTIWGLTYRMLMQLLAMVR